MSDTKEKGFIGYVLTLLGVGMSFYHLNIAYTGGYETFFQRGLSLLFALAMIFIIYSRPVQFLGRAGNAIFSVVIFLLAVSSVGWVLYERAYFLDRFRSGDLC